MILLGGLLLMLQAVAPPATPKPDRNAFTFVEYRLNATPDLPKHALTVEGDIVLRNDSDAPQSAIALQLSSSFQWTDISIGGKPLTHTDSTLASDVDHTGAMNEAVVSVPAVAPRGSVTLHVAYQGTIALDATRLRRLNTPPALAEQNDWDRITPEYTAFRGIGYVTWYPVALEPASLRDGNRVFEETAIWKERHQDGTMTLRLATGSPEAWLASAQSVTRDVGSLTMKWTRFGIHTPLVVGCRFTTTRVADGTVYALKTTPASQRYATVLGGLRPDGFDDAAPAQPISLVEAPPWITPFEADHLLLIPFSTEVDTDSLKVNLMHMAAHAYFRSPRAWLDEGFAHWAQLRLAETLTGRKSMLASLARRGQVLSLADSGEEGRQQPLIRAHDEVFYRTKASCVFVMLYDLVGPDAFLSAVKEYTPERDKTADHFQRLLEKHAHRDLEMFFDDWVYRDPGLPDFKVTSVYARQNLKGGFLVTVTIENSGHAGAEVPVFVRSGEVENMARVWVGAASTASARVSMPLAPQSAAVNDGSVPELDPGNNEFTVNKPQATSE